MMVPILRRSHFLLRNSVIATTPLVGAARTGGSLLVHLRIAKDDAAPSTPRELARKLVSLHSFLQYFMVNRIGKGHVLAV